MISFTQEVKNELAHVKNTDICCENAEIAGLLQAGGNVLVGSNRIGFAFYSYHAAVVRKALTILKKFNNLKIELGLYPIKKLKKKNKYFLRIFSEQNIGQLLQQLGILYYDKILRFFKEKNILKKICCKRTYLRGIFLGCGSVSTPIRDYHIEFILKNKEVAFLFIKLLKKFSIQSKFIKKKDNGIVYMKDAESIISFLRIIGANNGLFKFENVRVLKEMRNRINRTVNCETANLKKTVYAAARQIEKINYIFEKKGYDWLPLNLRITAKARVDNPDATINELVKLANSAISKSGINHRLRKLEEIYASLHKKEKTI